MEILLETIAIIVAVAFIVSILLLINALIDYRRAKKIMLMEEREAKQLKESTAYIYENDIRDLNKTNGGIK
jgi:hypothetical protein